MYITLYRKMTIYVHFSIYSIHLYWLQLGCLANTDFALDSSHRVTKRLWCIGKCQRTCQGVFDDNSPIMIILQ